MTEPDDGKRGKEKDMFHTSMETPRRPPFRISIPAILEGLQGIVLLMGLLVVIVAASSSGTMTIEGYPIMRADASIGSGLLAGVFPVVGLLSLLFSCGLWRLVPWALWAMVIVQLIGLTNSVLAFTQAPAHVVFILVGMVFPAFMPLYFLVNARVRAAFRTCWLQGWPLERRTVQ